MTDEKTALVGVIALARRLRVLTSRGPQYGSSEHPWSGRALHLRSASASDLFHDLAHYQISTPSRRRLAQFGRRRDEEPLASLLGIAWEFKYCGWESAQATALEHSWIDEYTSPWEIVRTAAKLEAMGFLDNGRPVNRLRGTRERIARLPL